MRSARRQQESPPPPPRQTYAVDAPASAGVYNDDMARGRKPDKEPLATDEEVREEIRKSLKRFREGLVDDPIPSEPTPQIDAAKRAVTYSGPVPIR
jgi:hypothetical protein